MTNNPNSGGSFDFDAEHRRGGAFGSGPGGPFDGGRFNNGPGGSGPGGSGPGGNSGKKPRRIGCGAVIGFVVVLLLIAMLFQSCGASSGSANCGDYDLVDGQYVENQNQGDYERNGDSYDYVGCDPSRSGGGGGFFFLPFFFGGGGGGTGSNYGDGSGFRGGGPGSGK
ncbi:hypothetical protein [Brevibacterium casei]|uniref:hypothetical protein n=1 Tax=Brevibacterium casei TaxID=33889 RepID=UPI000928A3E8|nr:hypothetical protein [Brevibacterium casei]SIH12743.1 Uncharacterised protein [Mycobacteroides abscessus subsp. abscessus]